MEYNLFKITEMHYGEYKKQIGGGAVGAITGTYNAETKTIQVKMPVAQKAGDAISLGMVTE